MSEPDRLARFVRVVVVRFFGAGFFGVDFFGVDDRVVLEGRFSGAALLVDFVVAAGTGAGTGVTTTGAATGNG